MLQYVYTYTTDRPTNTDPYPQYLIRERHRHRRKYQRTGYPLHKLHHNLLSNLVQKRIAETRNAAWQKYLGQIEKADSG